MERRSERIDEAASASGENKMWEDIPSDWLFAGIGDFNGDGFDDVLFLNNNNSLTYWHGTANDGFVGNWNSASPSQWSDFRIGGLGDFNGDGRSDVLWNTAQNLVTDWLGASTSFIGNWDNATVQMWSEFQIAGTGDFNGDGRSDILWRNPAGLVVEWLGQTSGGFIGNWDNAMTLTNDWQVAGVGDFNGDGRDDLYVAASFHDRSTASAIPVFMPKPPVGDMT